VAKGDRSTNDTGTEAHSSRYANIQGVDRRCGTNRASVGISAPASRGVDSIID
jgi:hypothetical protein